MGTNDAAQRRRTRTRPRTVMLKRSTQVSRGTNEAPRDRARTTDQAELPRKWEHRLAMSAHRRRKRSLHYAHTSAPHA